MNRGASTWLGASFVLACVGSLATGALVREHLRVEQSFWLISPIVYVVRDQHLKALVPFLNPSLTLVLWLPFAIGIVILIHNIRVGTPALSALPEIVAGLFVGGALANVLEARMIGSVTDFLGIPGLGTYSARDIALDVALSLLPIASIEIARAKHQTFTHVLQAGAVFYVAVVLFAVVSQDYALAVLVTFVIAVGAAASLTRRMISVQIPSR